MKLRNSAKAIIIQNNRLLAIRGKDPWGDYYLLPGGGQRAGETILEALQRECLEEIGTTVVTHDLRLVREYIGRNHEFAEYAGDVHQVELWPPNTDCGSVRLFPAILIYVPPSHCLPKPGPPSGGPVLPLEAGSGVTQKAT